MDAILNLTPIPNPSPVEKKISTGEGVTPPPVRAVSERGEAGRGVEPAWPPVDVIVGNPPFLGVSKLRSELGDVYSGITVQGI